MVIRPRKSVRDVVRWPVSQAERLDKLRLDKNENCAGWPTRVMDGMLAGLSRHFLTAYPEPHTLYEKIAKWHGITTDRLMVTAGSEMAIRYLFEAYLEPGDELVSLEPSFAMFEVYAQLCGAKFVPVRFDRSFRVSADDILKAITSRTKIVAIANPNNPTGTVIPERDLIAIVKKAAKHGALALVDEAYFHFYGRTMLHHTGLFDNLVVTRTFSKACGAASVRLGYAVGHPEVIRTMAKLQPIDHVSGFAVLVGRYLIDHDRLIADYVKEVERGKAYLLKELPKLGLPCIGGYGNFVLIDLGARKDEVAARLKAGGVLVGANLRLPSWSRHIRAAVGPPALMRRFVRALGAALA